MPGDGSNADELLDAADAALSVAVEEGGDRAVSAASMASRRMQDALAAEADREDSSQDDEGFGDGTGASSGPDADGRDTYDPSDFRSLDE